MTRAVGPAGIAWLTTALLMACGGGTASAPSAVPTATVTTEPTTTPTATVAQADLPAGRILFHRSGSDGIEKYFTIESDGSDEQAVYEAEGCECAHWSADGTRILTIGATDHGTWSLLTMNPDGSDKVVTAPPIETLSLFVGASSADGRVIAFSGMDENDASKSGLYVAAPDLTGLRLVTPLLEGWLAVEPFSLTPDGSKIAFFVDTGRDGGITHAGDLYVINADGSGLRKLNLPGPRPGYMGMPVISLSPDGRQAAFGVDDAVWVVDLEGGDAREITPRTGFVWAVSWSPTGEWLTYTRFHGHTTAVALVRPDGTDDHEISALDETDEANAAVWSPDGQYLLVPRDSDKTVDGPTDLWIMDLEGRWIGRVTNEPSNYGTYSWAPASGS
jgi:Tol biopolymer transport system component